MMQFGAFKLPQVPGVYGAPIDRVERELDIDIDGAVGAGLLASFRLTFADQGRVLWVEQRPPISAPDALAPGQPEPGGVGPRPGLDLEGTPLLPGILGPGPDGDPTGGPTLPSTPNPKPEKK